MNTSKTRIFVGAVLWAAATACISPPVEAPKTTVVQDTPVRVPQNEKNKVDVLFLIDNSPSMDAMQTELKTRFGDFFKVFQDLAAGGTFADMNIGVVTSDFGAGDTAGGGCAASPGGDRGILIAKGAAALASCNPPTGTPFIHYAFDPAGGPAVTNIPGGATLVDEFTCLASVGAGGCGFEHQLEAVYAALKNTNENKGFLRSDALLTVVFVTNEDDGSAAPNAKFYEQAGDPNTFGAYDTYRQTRFAVYCNGNPIPYGDGTNMALQNCTSAPNPMMDVNLAFPIDRYVNLFTQRAAMGGVKTSPQDVILVGIDGPEAPVATVLVQKGTGLGMQPNPSYVPCGPMLAMNCLERLQHVCQNTAQPAFFADPSVRLNAVIDAATFHQTASICGDNLNQPPNYSNALQQLGQLISSHISPGCIPAPLASYNAMVKNPQCTVEDVTDNPDGSQTIKEIPRCDLAGGQFPCWKIESKDQCKKAYPALCPGDSCGVGVTIDRNGGMAPANTNARVECSTVAQ
jgi:hypothetical protein